MSQFTPLTDQQLTQFLTKWDERSRTRLDNWLNATPPAQAAEQLAALIKKNKPPEPWILWVSAGATLLIILMPLLFAWRGGSKVNSFPPMFVALTPLFAAFGQRRIVYGRAATLLARLNDQRAVPGLADGWGTKLPWGSSRANRQESNAQSDELLRLLNGLSGPQVSAMEETRVALRALVRRSVGSRRKIPWDLGDSAADILLAAIRVLGRSATPADTATLRRVALAPLTPDSETRTPNRDLVREAARLFAAPELARSIDPPAPVIETSFVAPLPVASAQSPQVLGIKR